MKHYFSRIKDSESSVNAMINACDFISVPFPESNSGKWMGAIGGYHVCPLNEEELSGRGISRAYYNINPRTKKIALWYRMTVAAYKKLCKTRDVAENKDAHWDGIFVK